MHGGHYRPELPKGPDEYNEQSKFTFSWFFKNMAAVAVGAVLMFKLGNGIGSENSNEHIMRPPAATSTAPNHLP